MHRTKVMAILQVVRIPQWIERWPSTTVFWPEDQPVLLGRQLRALWTR